MMSTHVTSLTSSRAIVTSFAALLAAPNAWAESPPGFYAGGGFGAAYVAVEANTDNVFAAADEGQDDAASELHVGYRLRRHLGVELTYFGDTQPAWDRLAYAPAQGEAYRNLVALDIRTAELSVVGILPFARMWEAYVRGGVAFWESDADQTLIRLRDGAASAGSVSSSGEDFVFGLGIGASPTPAWHLRLEFQSFEVDPRLVLATSITTLDTFLFAFDFHTGARRPATEE